MSTAHVGWTIGGGLMAVAIGAATAWSAGAHPAPTAAAEIAAPSPGPPPLTATSPAAASSSAPAARAAQVAQAAQVQAQAEERLRAAQAQAALTALAQQLPTDVRLTAPAAWRTRTSSCPHLSDRLAAALGGHWRSSTGTLPAGPDGCSWTSATGITVGLGYERGHLPAAPTGEEGCAAATSVPVPAVAPEALLLGCDGATGHRLTLAVPGTGGAGVFLLHADGGSAVPDEQPSAALLAVLSAARHAYAG